MQLTTNVLGSFVLHKGKVIKQRLFKGGVEDIASKLRDTEGSYCAEESELLEELIETGNKRIHVDNPSRFQGSGLDAVFLDSEERFPVHRFASELGLERRDVDSLIRKVNRALTRERLKEVERDQILIQAVNSLDDIDEAVNRLIERLREWYSLHFPELDDLVSSHEAYANLVSEVGFRSAYPSAKTGFDPDFTDKIVKASEDSLGVDLTEEDLKAIRAFTRPIMELHKSKLSIEEYVTSLMDEIAPNISALAGPLLGARLIAMAHSLKRLSTLPAGTIQILGAEDAFFRFMKTGRKPPKHGIIFQYPAIRGAKKNVRGKLARTFAAKIALASRADAYKGEFIGDKLKKDFEKRVKSL
ncbi:MAG: C/D box methylation guide ribonucleoprotein complex aNOP56 subunit [Candidatus Altiarchaeales archaeon]|nr:C/D box methylation guide ribonucleoprotein complex aNOP56 subunit [Candidatus Altiarchaeales archaeon]MBD3417127.1 C/D box methylation guide ribonucleoprotein complex aNOP56 subunit [Candidatus Altiarchaeales archaeon]